MQKKPSSTLSQLEEEPVSGIFGCTISEITQAMKKSLFIAVLIVIIFSFMIPWQFAGILAIVTSALAFIIIAKKSGKLRTSRPLFYSKHVAMANNSRFFIQPAKRYQRERNYARQKSK